MEGTKNPRHQAREQAVDPSGTYVPIDHLATFAAPPTLIAWVHSGDSSGLQFRHGGA